jgi:hypothetical protein
MNKLSCPWDLHRRRRVRDLTACARGLLPDCSQDLLEYLASKLGEEADRGKSSLTQEDYHELLVQRKRVGELVLARLPKAA